MLQGLLPERKTLALIFAYGIWILLFRLLCLSLVVYFMTRQGRTATFEEINESFANNEIVFIGITSGLFLLLLKGLAPLLRREDDIQFARKERRSEYYGGFIQGATLATSIVLAFLVVGSFHFVGFFVQVEDAPFAIFGVLARIVAFLAIGLCEESIFRSEKISLANFPLRILSLAVLYCVVKLAQFDLSWMNFATLFLFSVALSVRRVGERSSLGGAGFWSALLIVFHPVFSLPVFGSDFSGLLMLKYQSQSMAQAGSGHLAQLNTMISGGPGGPLSSIALQAILLIEIVRGLLIQKKTLLKPSLSL